MSQKNIDIVNDLDTRLEVASNMEKYGGSFVRYLAKCIYVADSDNLQKIQDAW